MHSSRMRTARSLTVSPHMLSAGGAVPGLGGVYLVGGGLPGPRGCTWSGGVYLVPGEACLVQGGCTWSRGEGDVPGPGVGWGVYLVPGGVPGQVLPPP